MPVNRATSAGIGFCGWRSSGRPHPRYAARVLIPEGHHREFDDLVHVRIQSRGLNVQKHGPLHVGHRDEVSAGHLQPAKDTVVAGRLESGCERLYRRIS